MFFRWVPFVTIFSIFIFTIYEKILTNQNILFSIIENVDYGDKLTHFIFYGFLGFLLNYALYFKTFNIKNFSLQIGSFFILIFSIMEEYSQIYFIYRTFDLLDILANTIGVIAFSFLHKIKKI